jgi:hypothetical protein
MFKKLAICSLTAVMFGTGSVALAHTGVRDAAMDGKGLYTAFTIGHGCGSTTNTTPLPVIAQSVVFPNNADSTWLKLVDPDGTGPLPVTETPFSIDQAVQGALAGTPLAITPNLVQDTNVFSRMKEVADTSTLLGAHSVANVRAFNLKGGNLQTDLVGLVPFSIGGVKVKADSCVKSIKLRIAIANWCKTNATNTAQAGDEGRRADFWLGIATTKFNNPLVSSVPVAATGTTAAVAGYWPTLTINRDLVANPYPASCGGVGYDVAVQPSKADIDKYLPMMGYPLGK